MAKDGWSTETEENLPADQQTPHSGVWEDEATCKAKYSRVKEEDDVLSKESVDNLSETVVTESVSLNTSMYRAPSHLVEEAVAVGTVTGGDSRKEEKRSTALRHRLCRSWR